MRLLIFGGRNYNDWLHMIRELELLVRHSGKPSVIIHGDAPGADRMAKTLAHCMLYCADEPYPAQWNDIGSPHAIVKRNRAGKLYDASAGFRRNGDMIDIGKPDIAMGFAGGNGTADMAAKLKASNIPLINAGCIQ